MQNKANFKNSQMYVSLNISRDYEKVLHWTLGENKANQEGFFTPTIMTRNLVSGLHLVYSYITVG